jgi:hypothetical protein
MVGDVWLGMYGRGYKVGDVWLGMYTLYSMVGDGWLGGLSDQPDTQVQGEIALYIHNISLAVSTIYHTS